MKAIVNTAPETVEWLDRLMLEPGPGQVRIRTAACGICATDLEMIDGWDRTGFPSVPGHEWSGFVDAVGPDVPDDIVGKPCVAENVLTDGGEVGFEHPGGYGQYLLTEARNIYILPQDFPLPAAAMIEPLAVCVRALRRLRLEDQNSALVIGDGPIGLLMLLLLKMENVERVILVGGRPGRLRAARELGAAQTLNYHEAGADLAASVASLPGGPFPNVIEASGAVSGMETALHAAANGGKIIVIGDYGAGRADFPWNHLLHRELELIGTNASAGAWPEAVQLAVTGAVNLESLISRRLTAASYAEGLELARHSREELKVVLEWT